ncbi:MAG: hypothetical protein RIB86_16230 [Imperialibacter sp.]
MTNSRGLRVTDNVLIIESDDWGAIRTPSAAALDRMTEKGLQLADTFYKFDSLASEDDLDFLFNVLHKVRNIDGDSVKLTANTIVANPDFQKIRDGKFRSYFYEPFTDTLAQYPKHSKSFDKWRQGMAENIFRPQFHGREHLNINRWLRRLQEGDKDTLFCFDQKTTYSGFGDYSFMEAFDWDSEKDVSLHQAIIADGLELFEKIFRFKSKSFIAPCYNWDSSLDPNFPQMGIEILQSSKHQLVPTGQFGQYIKKRHHFGELRGGCPMYNLRNCVFEPSMNPNKDWVDSCLAEIQSAFTFRKPAVICSHRVNYIGFINEKNRDFSLCELERLLLKVVQKWPEVRFVFTDQVKNFISNENG